MGPTTCTWSGRGGSRRLRVASTIRVGRNWTGGNASFEEALGQVRPEPDDLASDDLVSMLELPRVALEAGVDWQTHARALRLYAESLGRIAETEAFDILLTSSSHPGCSVRSTEMLR
jgi:hypothetical protein